MAKLRSDKRHLGNIQYPWEDEDAKLAAAPVKLTSVVLNFSPCVLEAKLKMPQAGHGLELDLKGGHLESLKCSIETSSAYFRFGLKLLPEAIPLHGETTIQSKHDFLVHIGRNDWDRKGVAAADDLFVTYYRWGVKESGADERLFTVKPTFKAKLEFTLRSGSISLKIDGRERFETTVAQELCNRAALFAWNDHQGVLKVTVKDISATVLKPVPANG